jgi:hypothetical protein
MQHDTQHPFLEKVTSKKLLVFLLHGLNKASRLGTGQ